MRRTRWSRAPKLKQLQFIALTLEVPVFTDNIRDWEWRAAYVDAVEKADAMEKQAIMEKMEKQAIEEAKA